MTPPKEESDQLPEEQPGGAGGSDDTGSATRDEAEKNEGAERSGDDEEGQATGNPKNAG
jgi:hypothetical protein